MRHRVRPDLMKILCLINVLFFGFGACFFFFSSRRRHTRSLCDWSSDVCSSDLIVADTSRVAHAAPPGLCRRRFARNQGMQAVLVSKTGFAGGVLASVTLPPRSRSEERRVGKECRSRWAEEHEKKDRGGESSGWR